MPKYSYYEDMGCLHRQVAVIAIRVVTCETLATGKASNPLFFACMLKETSNMKNSNEKAISLKVADNLKVTILPNSDHEFLMTSKEVANGYGICNSRLSHHLKNHKSELTEGKHFVKGIALSATPHKGAQPNQRFWTKRGIVRLGFFIQSEQAKLFRDWAEDLIIKVEEQKDLFNQVTPTKALPAKRKHNRLTQDRMVDLLADVCQIEDKDLRMSITNKLLGGRV